MEKGKRRPGTGRASTDLLSRIRETAASKPEQQIRQLAEENRRLVHELGIAQVDLARLQEEQEQLLEAYDALDKRHDDDVLRLTKELEKSDLRSGTQEMDRDSLKPQLDTKPEEELDVKDRADGPKRGNDTSQFVSPESEQQIRRVEEEIRQLKAQLDEANTKNQASARIQGDHSDQAVVVAEEARFKQMEATIRQTREENKVLLGQLREVRGSISEQRAGTPQGQQPVGVRGPRNSGDGKTITQIRDELEEARATALSYEQAFRKLERKAVKWKELAEIYYSQTRGLWDANQAQEAELTAVRKQLQEMQSVVST